MSYEGNTHKIIENQELLDLFLPILRAGFKLPETYCHQACGVATFHTLDGGYFFITENSGPVVYIAKQTLKISDKILGKVMIDRFVVN